MVYFSHFKMLNHRKLTRIKVWSLLVLSVCPWPYKFRPPWKVPGHPPGQRWEDVPHLLPDVVWNVRGDQRWVMVSQSVIMKYYYIILHTVCYCKSENVICHYNCVNTGLKIIGLNICIRCSCGISIYDLVYTYLVLNNRFSLSNVKLIVCYQVLQLVGAVQAAGKGKKRRGGQGVKRKITKVMRRALNVLDWFIPSYLFWWNAPLLFVHVL